MPDSIFIFIFFLIHSISKTLIAQDTTVLNCMYCYSIVHGCNWTQFPAYGPGLPYVLIRVLYLWCFPCKTMCADVAQVTCPIQSICCSQDLPVSSNRATWWIWLLLLLCWTMFCTCATNPNEVQMCWSIMCVQRWYIPPCQQAASCHTWATNTARISGGWSMTISSVVSRLGFLGKKYPGNSEYARPTHNALEASHVYKQLEAQTQHGPYLINSFSFSFKVRHLFQWN